MDDDGDDADVKTCKSPLIEPHSDFQRACQALWQDENTPSAR